MNSSKRPSTMFGQLAKIMPKEWFRALPPVKEGQGGKITFWVEIDTQHVLPFGTPQDVRQVVCRFVNTLSNKKGGVVAQLSWCPNYPTENIVAAYEEFCKD